MFVLFFVFVLVQKPAMAKCSAIFDCKSYYVQEMWMHLPAALELFNVLVEVMNATNDGDVLAMLMEEVDVVCSMQCP